MERNITKVTRVLNQANRVTRRVSEVLNLGSAGCVVITVVLVSYSAISRYLFTRAVFFMEELCGLLLVGITFMSFAVVAVEGRHIKVTLIAGKLPARAKKWLGLVGGVVTLVYLIIFIRLSYDYVYVSYKVDVHSPSAYIYEVPFMALMPIGAAVVALVVLLFCVNRIYSIAIGKAEGPEYGEPAETEEVRSAL